MPLPKRKSSFYTRISTVVQKLTKHEPYSLAHSTLKLTFLAPPTLSQILVGLATQPLPEHEPHIRETSDQIALPGYWYVCSELSSLCLTVSGGLRHPDPPQTVLCTPDSVLIHQETTRRRNADPEVFHRVAPSVASVTDLSRWELDNEEYDILLIYFHGGAFAVGHALV